MVWTKAVMMCCGKVPGSGRDICNGMVVGSEG
jgi:hypothetical protein